MLSPLRSLLDVAELASQSHSLLVLLVFCFGGLFVFVCLFVVCLWLLCLCRLLGLVSVHDSSTFEALFNCLRQCFNNSVFLQHAIERVKRPGESQEALDGNKSASISELCPNKPLTISCYSHHASYNRKRSTCSPYAQECTFPTF